MRAHGLQILGFFPKGYKKCQKIFFFQVVNIHQQVSSFFTRSSFHVLKGIIEVYYVKGTNRIRTIMMTITVTCT